MTRIQQDGTALKYSTFYYVEDGNREVADTDAAARRLLSSLQQAFVQLRRGRPGPLPAPVDDLDERLMPQERAMLADLLACTFVGSPDTVQRELEGFVGRVEADELIVSAMIHDQAARLRSYALAAEVRDRLAQRPTR